ncbi:hypothetical protein [Candidatus Protochlamydia amoebophila]|uniref:Uncharacterized protein n=1 Tax=Protochlamydia amoebophila (strain UWE25) TaxID=264201 RepID=Q6MEH1_PARUW|nr:hypothetical protein [Candidatus Protochlamydia amoebophila]CAF23028.1 unnamed protein product [Candidatus Protochlamydia amoebophila UWE25]
MFLNKWFVVFLIFLLSFLGIYFYNSLTDGFRIAHITHQLDFTPFWKTSNLSEHEKKSLKAILDQKYTYLGKGAQSYAFVSADHQYVLKFFKFKNFKPHFLVKLLPSLPPFNHYKQLYLQRKQKKLMSVFNGYDIAYQQNKLESGLIYLHLLPTNFLNYKVTLEDKMGIIHKVDLDSVAFLIQRKGETLGNHLTSLLEQGNQEKAKQAISKIFTMYMQEYQKGIYDRDHSVIDNTGFIGENPFHLDAGKLTRDDLIKQRKFYKKDLEQVAWKIDQWIKKKYPDYYYSISSYLANNYNEWIGEIFDPAKIDLNHYRKNRHVLNQAEE